MTDFEQIFHENRNFIYKYLMRLSADASLAEELTQETFFRAYMNMASLRCREKAPAWLCRIARNAYFAWYNEQKKLKPMEEAMAPETGCGPEELFVQKELSQQALACLDGLEEPYREVFILSVFGQIPLKEISTLFGKSESWARVTFYRAKQKLTEEMR